MGTRLFCVSGERKQSRLFLLTAYIHIIRTTFISKFYTGYGAERIKTQRVTVKHTC